LSPGRRTNRVNFSRSVRALEAHDRSFGRPDPPFARAPAFAESRRTARPRERRTHPRGVARVLRGSVRRVAPRLVRRSRPAVSAAPVFPSTPRAANRRSRPRLSRPRAPLQGTITEGSTPIFRTPLARRPLGPLRLAPETFDPPRFAPERRSTPPSLASLPYSAFGAAGPVFAGVASPATFRPRRFSRPRRFAPRDTFRVYFTPVTLLGFRLQGVAPLRGPDLSRGRCSPAVRIRARAPLSARANPRSSELCSPRRVRTAKDRNPARGRCPPGVCPSKALSASARGPDRPTTTRPCERGDEASRPFLPCTSSARDDRSARAAGASEFSPAEDSAFPLLGGAGLSGVRHLVPGEPFEPTRVSMRFPARSPPACTALSCAIKSAGRFACLLPY